MVSRLFFGVYQESSVIASTSLMVSNSCIFNGWSGSSNEWERKNIIYESSEVGRSFDEDQTRQRSKSKILLCDFSIVICRVGIRGGC